MLGDAVLRLVAQIGIGEHRRIERHVFGRRVRGHFDAKGFEQRLALGAVALGRVDLVEQLGLNEPSTFLARVRGLSMIGKGIDDGDLLVVNRLIEAKHGQTVVAVVDNELTCKTLYQRGGMVKLQAANPDFTDIVLKDGQTLVIWGVVVSVVKRMPV